MNINIIKKEIDKLMKKAIKKGEVPVSAIIVSNNKIIAKSYNKVEKYNNFMKHAEIIAIEKAMKIKNNWRLNDCDIYVSLEPCDMCKEIIKKSRIQNVYYFSKQNCEIKNKKNEYHYIEDKTISDNLKKFFIDKRSK